MSPVDFPLFLVMWNRRQNQRTPAIHKRMARWLEEGWRKGDARLLLMAFRSSGKSTICGLFAAWLLYTNPDLRILVIGAESALAEKLARNARRIIEKHPLTSGLKPGRADQWARDRFTVNRSLELRDPSMLARGVSANITGTRADVIICDDVETPNTCDTPEKRRDLRERLAELNFILVPGGAALYIGTPHTYYTIYADAARREIGEKHEFLKGFDRFLLPVLDEEGKSAWPSRFTPEDIERVKISAGPNLFASQMMLRPVNIAEGRLDPGSLQIYGGDLYYARELGQLHIDGKPMVCASAWWDPAFGNARGDHSVLAAVYADAEGSYYLHRLAYIKNDPDDAADEASQQCWQVVQIAKELMLPSIAIETNGIGKFLPAILRNELARARVPCAVMEISSRRPKDLRILEAFDAVLAARKLRAHENVLKTPFVAEMQEWRPGANKGHDDGLDAVAGALSLQPVRLPKIYGAGGYSWMNGAKTRKAKTEFEV